MFLLFPVILMILKWDNSKLRITYFLAIPVLLQFSHDLTAYEFIKKIGFLTNFMAATSLI